MPQSPSAACTGSRIRRPTHGAPPPATRTGRRQGANRIHRARGPGAEQYSRGKRDKHLLPSAHVLHPPVQQVTIPRVSAQLRTERSVSLQGVNRKRNGEASSSFTVERMFRSGNLLTTRSRSVGETRYPRAAAALRFCDTRTDFKSLLLPLPLGPIMEVIPGAISGYRWQGTSTGAHGW